MPRKFKNRHLHILEKEKLYGDVKSRVDGEPKQKHKEKEPSCPIYFSRDEKRIWEKYKEILKEYDLFYLAAGPVLELLVKNISDRTKCLDHIKREGICIETLRGKIYNPYWSAKNKCEENIRKYLDLLGITNQGLAKLGLLRDMEDGKDTGEDLLD